MSHFVYILKCNNGSYYTGYTSDLERRYQEHLRGIKCKYTRSFKPLGIAQSWTFVRSKSLALRIEKFIKSLSREQKDKIIQDPQLLLTLHKKHQRQRARK